MNRGTLARIDLRALTHNFSIAKTHAGGAKIAAVVKADAYGHGVVEICRALPEVDAFAVAFIDEALELREAGITQPILILEGIQNPAELALAQQQGLELVIHSYYQFEWFKTYVREHAPGTDWATNPGVLWLKLDTGMHRLGLNAEEAQEIAGYLRTHAPGCELRLMGHFACADELDNPLTARQQRAFHRASAGLNGAVSLANSAALLAWPETRADWVRPGIMLYGSSPFAVPPEAQNPAAAQRTALELELQPVMTLVSVIIAMRELQPGDAVGYGQQWRATKPCRIGTVAIGYADGYPRALPSGTPVLVRNQIVPLLGRVSMDMISIDLSDCAEARIGDEVVLWGVGNPIDRIAQLAGTISYELLCSVSGRVPRQYLS